MTSIIQSLKSEGVLKLYHDYRSGHADDLSGNSHNGDLTNSEIIFSKEGFRLTNTTDDGVKVASHADFDFSSTGVALVVLGDFPPTVTSDSLLIDKNTGGDFYLRMHPTAFFTAGGGVLRQVPTGSVQHSYAAASLNLGVDTRFYRDGLLVGTPQAAVTPAFGGTDIEIGGRSSAASFGYRDGAISAALIFSRGLTATEHAQLYAELSNMTWPNKKKEKALVNVNANLSDTTLVGAWDMKPVNNTIIDLSPTGNDGVLSEGPTHESTILGNSMRFDGVASDIDMGLAIADLSNNYTVSFWAKYDADDSNNYTMVGADAGGANRFYVRKTITNQLIAVAIYDDTINAAGKVVPGVFHHFVVVVVGTGATVYINGVNEGTVSGLTITKPVATIHCGSDGAGATAPLLGQVLGLAVYDEAKESDWVAKEYAKGARAVQYKTDYGIKQSVANVTAGELEDSGWRISTGTWKVTTDTINGQPVKVFENIVQGILYLPIEQFMTSAESAYGSWEFFLRKKLDSGTFYVLFVSDIIGGQGASGQDGYQLLFSSAETLAVREMTNGSITNTLMSTAASAFNINTWYKSKLTRSSAGVTHLYMDGVLVDVSGGTGTNPATDNTHTTSKYIVFDLDAGDKIAIASPTGDHAITKYLGVI